MRGMEEGFVVLMRLVVSMEATRFSPQEIHERTKEQQ